MKGYTIEARYAPELMSAISSAMRQIEFNRRQRALGGLTDYVAVDDTLTGHVSVIIVETSDASKVVRWDNQIQPTRGAA